VRFSAEEFRGAVLSPAPRVAVFDCDGTLWNGDAGPRLYDVVDGGGAAFARCQFVDRCSPPALPAGRVSEVTICGEMVQVYAGLRDDELRRALPLLHRARRGADLSRDAVSGRRSASGWRRYLGVSSTNDWVIEEGIRRFGISPARVLAARVRVKDGLITAI